MVSFMGLTIKPLPMVKFITFLPKNWCWKMYTIFIRKYYHAYLPSIAITLKANEIRLIYLMETLKLHSLWCGVFYFYQAGNALFSLPFWKRIKNAFPEGSLYKLAKIDQFYVYYVYRTQKYIKCRLNDNAFQFYNCNGKASNKEEFFLKATIFMRNIIFNGKKWIWFNENQLFILAFPSNTFYDQMCTIHMLQLCIWTSVFQSQELLLMPNSNILILSEKN